MARLQLLEVTSAQKIALAKKEVRTSYLFRAGGGYGALAPLDCWLRRSVLGRWLWAVLGRRRDAPVYIALFSYSAGRVPGAVDKVSLSVAGGA